MVLVLLSSLFSNVAQAAPWAGIYVTQGNKGTLTLTLRDMPDGIEGTLAGGGASFSLEGEK
ncbi:hypothetical protein EON80_13040, partial [bacterium]